jgi:hypothetical protein
MENFLVILVGLRLLLNGLFTWKVLNLLLKSYRPIKLVIIDMLLQPRALRPQVLNSPPQPQGLLITCSHRLQQLLAHGPTPNVWVTSSTNFNTLNLDVVGDFFVE